MTNRRATRPTRDALIAGAGAALTLTLLFALPVLAADLPSLDLRTVLANTTVTPPGRVTFREERHNPMLAEPLVLTGHLEYLELGVLRKVIETPFQEAFQVDAQHIIIERDGQTRKLSLNKSRSLRTILGAIEAILADEADRLESDFDYELSGTVDSWTVRLTPISQRIAKQLESLQVSGDGESATGIRVDLAGGEWHQMEISRNVATQ
jgi:hypothetical protein